MLRRQGIVALAALWFLFAAAGAGCGAGGANGVQGVTEPATDIEPAGTPAGTDDVPAPGPVPTSTATARPAPTPTPTSTDVPAPVPTTVGDGCHTNDPNHFCLALKYVAYVDSAGTPVMVASDAVANLTTINSIWSQCNVGFQIDQFVVVNPTDYGLVFATKNMAEFDDIRHAFQTDSTMLVATTGKWNRNGDITQGNAWTNYPGGAYHGAIVEAPSGKYAPIIAHELGHYMYLPHVNDTSEVMNPTIYTYSTGLTSAECSKARAAVSKYWPKMLR